jgi:hypothetical protein
MTRSSNSSGDPVVSTLDQELELVRTSIAMVESGGAPRILLGSLRFGEQLIEPARRLALGTHVRIVPLWTTDEAGAGIAVERIDGE